MMGEDHQWSVQDRQDHAEPEDPDRPAMDQSVWGRWPGLGPGWLMEKMAEVAQRLNQCLN